MDPKIQMFKTLFLEEVHPSLASMMISFTHEHVVQIQMTNGIMTQDVLLLMDQVPWTNIALKIEGAVINILSLSYIMNMFIKSFFLSWKEMAMSW